MECVTCFWCDEQTAEGAACAHCGGDPGGPFSRPSGMAATRERQVRARQALLAGHRAEQTRVLDLEEPPPADPLPPGPPVWTVEPEPERSRAVAIALAIGIPVIVLAAAAAAVTLLGTTKPHPSTTVSAAPAAAAPSTAPPTTALGPADAIHPWVRFDGAEFAATFPSVPTERQASIDCGCGTPIAIRLWGSVDVTARYIVAETTLPSGAAATPNEVIDGMVSGVLQDSNVTFSAGTPTTIGPYQVRDLTITGTSYGAAARVLVGDGRVWILVGRAAFNGPPDWDYFLKSFAPKSGPAPVTFE